MLVDYFNMIEQGYMYSGDNIIVSLYGFNGAKNMICHCKSKNFPKNVYSTITMYNLMNDQFSLNTGIMDCTRKKEPAYIINGFIDLDKFNIVPIKNNEISEFIKPDTYYVVKTGDYEYKMVMSNENCSLTCPNIQGYLPISSKEEVNKIYAKHNKLKRKLIKLQEDF
jgi:hypothetical protein